MILYHIKKLSLNIQIMNFYLKQGRKRPLDTTKRMIKRERRKEIERKVEGKR